VGKWVQGKKILLVFQVMAFLLLLMQTTNKSVFCKFSLVGKTFPVIPIKMYWNTKRSLKITEENTKDQLKTLYSKNLKSDAATHSET
jgi:hypothetical protein